MSDFIKGIEHLAWLKETQSGHLDIGRTIGYQEALEEWKRAETAQQEKLREVLAALGEYVLLGKGKCSIGQGTVDKGVAAIATLTAMLPKEGE